MAKHRIYCETVPEAGFLEVTGPEAHHALRVKRLEKGDAVQVLDGKGSVGEATVEGASKNRRGEWEMTLLVGAVSMAVKVVPRIEVCSGVPKGPRLEDMIDQLSQVGVAGWRPLLCERTVVEPREGKLERLKRAAAEAAKQCGRAWFMEIVEPIAFDEAVVAEDGVRVIVADASGETSTGDAATETTRLLVGPEGGFSDGEMALARRSGARIVRFGAHVMRVETAATVAAAVLLRAAARANNG